MAVDSRLSQALVLDRVRGCLTLGAAGDALGYPVEFCSEGAIREDYGPWGISSLADAGNPALFSDDTQMTLFTAAGLLHGIELRGRANVTDVWLAYREWLCTQGDDSRLAPDGRLRLRISAEKGLYAWRAPGNTCMGAIRTSKHGGTLDSPVNHSKGCGGVMRVAPCGIALQACKPPTLEEAMDMGAACAALTHGHTLGWLPAAALAGIVHELVYSLRPHEEPTTMRGNMDHAFDDPNQVVLKDVVLAISRKIELMYGSYPHASSFAKDMFDTALAALTRTDDLARIHELGEGWVGDEALLIAVHCAIAHASDPAEALRVAVNHKGDSDSTGAVCGNILGALHGLDGLRERDELCLKNLEQGDLIVDMATKLCEASMGERAADSATDGTEDAQAPAHEQSEHVEEAR